MCESLIVTIPYWEEQLIRKMPSSTIHNLLLRFLLIHRNAHDNTPNEVLGNTKLCFRFRGSSFSVSSSIKDIPSIELE